jgi:hypothetical protein
MDKKIIGALHGTIKISDSFTISRDTTIQNLTDYFGTNQIDTRDMNTGYVRYSVKHVLINNTVFAFCFIFHATQLDSVSFDYDFNGDSWDNWSEEKEFKRVEKYNKWLTEQVGIRRQFQWGTAWALYDNKGGGASLGLRYKR